MTHADRDGSERELSAYLAADKAEPTANGVPTCRHGAPTYACNDPESAERYANHLSDRRRELEYALAAAQENLARVEAWQREVCDYYGYDSEVPGATAEVLTYLPAWLAESSAEREALADERAKVARVEALADSLEVLGKLPIEKRPDGLTASVEACAALAGDLRAALAGDA